MPVRSRLLALAAMLLACPASAQLVYGPATITSGKIDGSVKVTPNGGVETTLGAALAAVGGGGGCALAGCTYSGPIATVGISDTGGITTTNPVGISANASIDYSLTNPFAGKPGNAAAGYRPNFRQVTLNPSANTNNTWESMNSWVINAGPGNSLGEINAGHAYYQQNAGTLSVQVEAFETSMTNNGTLGIFDGFLSVNNNGASGVVTGALAGYQASLNQQNATAGSIPMWVSFNCTVTSGGGSVPTGNFCLKNADPAQAIATLGSVSIGSVAQPLSTRLLSIFGPDTLAGTFPLIIMAGGVTQFSVTDAGTSNFSGTINLGIAGGAANGALQINTTTSGQGVKLFSQSGVAGVGVITIPDVTDTLAVRGTSQTFTQTQTYSGTLNVSGTLQAGGVAGVSCAAASVVLTTFVVTGGVVTHC